MNPYAQYLNGQDPVAVIADTAQRLRAIAGELGMKAGTATLAPGKWTVREIICHLADCEIAFGFRLRQALAEDHHVVQPFDQDRWADYYSGYELQQALALFEALRNWNLALIRTAGPGVLSKPVHHPERGEMTFQTLVETMGGHDLNHVAQLEAIVKHNRT
jgi:hypothetical protein